jgi:competence protein CoiA
MMYAELDGVRSEAHPGATGATCPICRGPVVAKCGRIVVWHWAHHTRPECDEWAESDSEWHRSWQTVVPAERREVIMGRHRADIVTTQGLVVEVQHSNLSVDEIAEREFYYSRMVWIFDAREAVRQERLDLRTKQGSAPNYRTFRWKHPRKSIAACRAQVWLDLGNDLLLKLGRIYPKAPCGGYGTLHRQQDLIDAINAPVQLS